MKKFKDIKIGDTVYIYGRLEPVQRFTVTYIEEFDINNPYNLYRIGYDNFGSKPKSCQMRKETHGFNRGRNCANSFFG